MKNNSWDGFQAERYRPAMLDEDPQAPPPGTWTPEEQAVFEYREAAEDLPAPPPSRRPGPRQARPEPDSTVFSPVRSRHSPGPAARQERRGEKIQAAEGGGRGSAAFPYSAEPPPSGSGQYWGEPDPDNWDGRGDFYGLDDPDDLDGLDDWDDPDEPEDWAGPDEWGGPDDLGSEAYAGAPSFTRKPRDPSPGAGPEGRRNTGRARGGVGRTGPDAGGGDIPEQTGSGGRYAYGAARTLEAMARTAELALDPDGEESPDRKLLQGLRRNRRRIRMARRGVRAARRGARAASSAARAAGSTVRRASAAVSSAVRNLAQTGAAKLLAMKAALPVILVLVLILLVLVTLLLTFTVKSEPEELSEVYLYITELDAALERSLREAGASVPDVTWWINGEEATVDELWIHTDADRLLLYLDACCNATGLADPVSGAFGGATVREEIDAIHSLLYSVRIEETTAPEAGPDPEEGPGDAPEESLPADPEAVPSEALPEEPPEVIALDIFLTTRSVWPLLEASGALSSNDREAMGAIVQLGTYAALEALSSPFSGPWYVKERWGWYADTDDQLRQRSGIVLAPLAGEDGAVSSCCTGTVTETGADFVTVSLDGHTLVYGQLTAVAVREGQEVERGERLGSISADRGLSLRYDRNGVNVNPIFFLPASRVPGPAGGLVGAAASQLGNVGGEPYWSWYGYPSYVNWCACFVSWCADQCGYLDAGTLPKFSSCDAGARWFRDRGLWQGRDYTPLSGQLIFFDWEGDGDLDHVGIVARVEAGTVYTIEGNSGNRCREQHYTVGDDRISGYGTPEYET